VLPADDRRQAGSQHVAAGAQKSSFYPALLSLAQEEIAQFAVVGEELPITHHLEKKVRDEAKHSSSKFFVAEQVCNE